MLRARIVAAALCVLLRVPAVAGEPLDVVTWGGSYEASQRRAIFEPFTRATGIGVTALQYDGSLAPLLDPQASTGWDVIDMLEDQAIEACARGLLRPLDVERLLSAGARADFMGGAFRHCSVAQNVFATVIAYDDRAFPGLKPSRVEDFFDTETFPGKRAIEKSPDVILEWAMMAEGVPAAQVYDLLSSHRGLELAFRKLDLIRDEIVWWDTAAEAGELLRTGRAAMASGYNGRFFSLAIDEGAPITIIWDGRLIGYEVWAIPAGSDQIGEAEAFLGFALQPGPMARLSELIPYGPTRRSALDRVGLHPAPPIPMLDHLPNATDHAGRALRRDGGWYASTRKLRMRRFRAWLERGSVDGE